MKKTNKLHNEEKLKEENRIKGILESYDLIEKEFIKSEQPDFIKGNVGLEITQVDTGQRFDAFMVNKENKTLDVLKYNKKYKKAGGRIIEKNNPYCLTPEEFDENGYAYILPGFDCIKSLEQTINSKLDKLERYQILDEYLLAVYAPFIINIFNICEYEDLIQNVQKNRKIKFSTIFIITNNNVVIFKQNTKTNIIFSQ